MTVAYIECQAGASGDMFLGAWLDLGIDAREWTNLLGKLSVSEYDLSWRTVYKNGMRATKVDVMLEETVHASTHELGQKLDSHHHVHGGRHAHRHLPDIYNILEASQLPEPVLAKSKEAFRLLAEAEGRVHGVPANEVHFHEVGAVDAIVDIVGSILGWYLAGMPECYVSSIEVGGGTVWCDHGLMLVPAPATAELLRGFRTHSSGNWGETVTPTGAAIIRTLCKSERVQGIIADKLGYGAGTKDFKIANVLRIQLGTKSDCDVITNSKKFESVCILETNLDDMTPELAGYVADKLMEHGALDAWWTAIVMKKGRPAIQLQVLCHPRDRNLLIDLIQAETTTLGVRVHETTRAVLDRRIDEVETNFGRVRVKVAYSGDMLRNVAPEYEDCKRCAEDHGVPLKQVYQATLVAYHNKLQN
ncbi:nickel pincer cofactor biosynthesis protein LarC [Alicyclobacillus dauci]|uniref:Pyridinium-3,5-bisthiocarboxylic acid mononucleotide nickel insertion protein n=1 Tax=Alicyclobacillus dauci TaxID=1475485 RepID=A0ABY6YYA3_9BACL|nr:nickel pincer cofactor biosynthesis protein LarC [Alicyclobacillus dauci]WAH35238.1 nickel pincer cofactor biosynthesis protein LarC [Alicyclobacillus dauci]